MYCTDILCMLYFGRFCKRKFTSLEESSGFTFLEVLIALVILSIAGLGVIHLIQDGQDTLGRVRLIERAEAVAVIQLEDIEKDGVSTILDREGLDVESGLQWKARAYSMKQNGFYRLAISVFENKEKSPLFTMEKIFIERF